MYDVAQKVGKNVVFFLVIFVITIFIFWLLIAFKTKFLVFLKSYFGIIVTFSLKENSLKSLSFPERYYINILCVSRRIVKN